MGSDASRFRAIIAKGYLAALDDDDSTRVYIHKWQAAEHVLGVDRVLALATARTSPGPLRLRGRERRGVISNTPEKRRFLHRPNHETEHFANAGRYDLADFAQRH